LSTNYKINKFPHISIINPTTGELKCIIQIPPTDRFPIDAHHVFLQLLKWVQEAPEIVFEEEVKTVSQPPLEEMKNKQSSTIDPPSSNGNTDHNKSVDSGTKETDTNSKDKDTVAPITLDSEPSNSDPEATELRIRLPQGSVISRRFKKSALVEDVYRFVGSTCNKENVSLVQRMPFLKLNDQKNKTLQELNLEKVTLVCSYE